MKEKITVKIDSKLLDLAFQRFGISKKQINYSEIVDSMLRYFLTPRFEVPEENRQDELLQKEPIIDMHEIEQNYDFDISEIEGEWPGDEPIEELISMLNQ